jgi:glycosyltransferase involved in cell wall biosynthesis
VPPETLAVLFAGAEAVLVVGLHEGFGLPVLEGLASGRPVVASRTGAALESAGDLGIPCDPRDEASLRGALERAAADTALRERAAAEGPAWADKWSWSETASGLLAACHAVKDPAPEEPRRGLVTETSS